MKKELDFLNVDGCYGGDQHWFKDAWQVLAGCSTVVASEIAVYLANAFPGLRSLSPCPLSLSREAFTGFAQEMYQYVFPGLRGMPKTSIFIRRFGNYARSLGVPVRFAVLPGSESFSSAKAFITGTINEGYPVTNLLLNHHDRELEELTWHWFNITGYEEAGEDLVLFFATWGEKRQILLSRLWDTQKEELGGMLAVKQA